MFYLIRITILALTSLFLFSCQQTDESDTEIDCIPPSVFQTGDAFSYDIENKQVLTHIIDYEVMDISPLTVDVYNEEESYTITFNGSCNGPDRSLTWYEERIFYPAIGPNLNQLPETTSSHISEAPENDSLNESQENKSLFNYDVTTLTSQGTIELGDSTGLWKNQRMTKPRFLLVYFELFVDDEIEHSLTLTSLYLTDL